MHRSGARVAATYRTSRRAPNSPSTLNRRSGKSPVALWRSRWLTTTHPERTMDITERVYRSRGSLNLLHSRAPNREITAAEPVISELVHLRCCWKSRIPVSLSAYRIDLSQYLTLYQTAIVSSMQGRSQRADIMHVPRHGRSIFVTASFVLSRVSIFCPWTQLATSVPSPRLPGLSPSKFLATPLHLCQV